MGTFQSGHRPLLNDNTTNANGIVEDLAEIVPGCQIATSGSTTQRLNNWINQHCIAPYPIIGDEGVARGFGNSRMGILRGPSQVNTDLSLIKLFSLGSQKLANLKFRTEFFNAFNHLIFSDTDNPVSDGPAAWLHQHNCLQPTSHTICSEGELSISMKTSSNPGGCSRTAVETARTKQRRRGWRLRIVQRDKEHGCIPCEG